VRPFHDITYHQDRITQLADSMRALHGILAEIYGMDVPRYLLSGEIEKTQKLQRGLVITTIIISPSTYRRLSMHVAAIFNFRSHWIPLHPCSLAIVYRLRLFCVGAPRGSIGSPASRPHPSVQPLLQEDDRAAE
jgi:hypothetical protein